MDGSDAGRPRPLLDTPVQATDGGRFHTTAASLPCWFVFPTTLCRRVGDWLLSCIEFPRAPVHCPRSLFQGKPVAEGPAAACTRSGGEWELRTTRRGRRWPVTRLAGSGCQPRSPIGVTFWGYPAWSEVKMKVNATLIVCNYHSVMEASRRRIYVGGALIALHCASLRLPHFPASDAPRRLFLHVPVVRAAVGDSRRHIPPTS